MDGLRDVQDMTIEELYNCLCRNDKERKHLERYIENFLVKE